MGMLGESAIIPLVACMNDPNHKEFGRVIAADGLAEIAKRQITCRERIIQCYRDYMRSPDLSAHALNGLLIGRMLDLDAKEAIDDIRLFFNKDCVDITCAGDLEEVEIELGFRSERSTPKPDFAQLYGLNSLHVPEKPQSDNILETIDFYTPPGLPVSGRVFLRTNKNGDPKAAVRGMVTVLLIIRGQSVAHLHFVI